MKSVRPGSHATATPPSALGAFSPATLAADTRNAGCAYLVTGDKDLLALKRFAETSIVTPREFATLVAAI